MSHRPHFTVYVNHYEEEKSTAIETNVHLGFIRGLDIVANEEIHCPYGSCTESHLFHKVDSITAASICLSSCRFITKSRTFLLLTKVLLININIIIEEFIMESAQGNLL